MKRKIWNLPVVEYISLQDYEEFLPACLVYTKSAWDAAKDLLKIEIACEIEITDVTQAAWDVCIPNIKGEMIYAVGGGLAVDAAKYFASQTNMPLISVPTAISVDAFFTWASGVRADGGVHYLETQPPDQVLIDLEFIAKAPSQVRAAGICDALSIATGNWDWLFAHQKKQLTHRTPFVPYVSKCAETILGGAMSCASAAGRGNHHALKQLVDCLCMEVQLCNQIGHSRPEEGSEHYFAYAVENVMGKGLPHGDLVGPGILIMAEMQGQPVAPLKKALDDCGIPLSSIPDDAIRQTLKELPAYCRDHNLPYGIAHEINDRMIDLAMS